MGLQDLVLAKNVSVVYDNEVYSVNSLYTVSFSSTTSCFSSVGVACDINNTDSFVPIWSSLVPSLILECTLAHKGAAMTRPDMLHN